MRIGIVGGGIAGLTAGYRLAQAGHQVSIYEALPVIGGQAGTFSLKDEGGRMKDEKDRSSFILPPSALFPPGPRLEYYYHHLFQSDHAAIGLIHELGLGDRLAWLSSKNGYFYGGQIYDFVTPLDLLRFKPLPFFYRLALGAQTLWLQTFGDWRKLEQVTARDWVLKWGGRPIYDVLWGALIRAKYGAFADQVSMAWLWGKIIVRRSLKGQGLAKETLGYLLGSFQLLSDTLAARIMDKGGAIYINSPVERVLVEGGVAKGLLVRQGEALRPETFDAVLLTVADPLVLQMVPELPADYAAPLKALQYQAAEVLVLKIKHSLSRIYWLNLPEEDIPLVGAIEHTNYIPPEQYEGARLLYLSNYLPASDPRFALDKEALLAYYTPYVQRINPAFDPTWVEASWLFKDRFGQPVVGVNYSRSIPSHRTPIRGLYLANTTQIYPEDRGVNYSVRLGEVGAEFVQGREARVSERW